MFAPFRPAPRMALLCAITAIACHARVPLRTGPQFAGTGDLAELVDPFIGTGGHGHTYPGATVPFGMVQLSPDTGTKGWDRSSGYHDSDSSILGFSHTHLSGTGAGDLGDILLVPTVGEIQLEPGPPENPDAGYRSRFSHADETATPGSYTVRLQDPSIKVELTATARAGFHRYIFPATREANVLIDLGHGITDVAIDSALTVVGDRLVTGYRRSRGWAKDQIVYFAAEVSKPFSSFGVSDGGALELGHREAKSAHGAKAALRFETAVGESILIKVGISAVDREGAIRNLRAEIPGWDFDAVRAAARSAWNRELGKIEIAGGDERTRRIFYTALYHTLLAPTLFSDVDGRYRGSDLSIHAAPGFDYYSTFSLWDTFRTAHPLYTERPARGCEWEERLRRFG